MTMLNQDVIKSINESVLCWLATVNEKNEPNVSPKEMFIADGSEHILIANIASPTSVRNIATQPAVCLSFINVFKQKGYKVNGQARVIEINDEDFSDKERLLKPLGGELFNIKSIIEIQVENITAVIAPSYWLMPETTEESQIKQAMNTYGVCTKKIK